MDYYEVMKMEETTEPKKEEPKQLFPGLKEGSSETLIDKANAAAERLEKANEQMETLVAKQIAAKTEQILGGSATTTEPNQEKTKEEKEIASARRLLAGTGYEDQLFPEEKK